MKTPLNFGEGVFPDVAFAADGTIVSAFRVPGGPVLVQWLTPAGELLTAWRIDVGMADNTFCRLLAIDGVTWLAYRALRDDVPQAVLQRVVGLELGPEQLLGRASGNSPVCLGEGLVAWQNDQDGCVWGRALEGGDRRRLRSETRGTGLSRLIRESVVFIDEDRGDVAGMLNPVHAGDCIVGEGPSGGLAVQLHGRTGFLMPGDCNVPRVATDGQGHYVAVTWGGPGVRLLAFTAEDVAIPEPPIPAQPIGPLSAPRAADGRVYDLQPFIIGAPETWPRSGPTHPMHQTPVHEGLFEFLKFGNAVQPPGSRYEQWGVNDGFFYLLEDASDTASNTWTDKRHFPRRMAIGLSRGFVSGPHAFVSADRVTCRELERRSLGRAVWILGLWDRYWCGPDLNERAVVALVMDPTEGVHNDRRMIEVNYFAFNAGWFRWESHFSTRVYATPAPRFDESTLEHRSDFYRLGGPVMTPRLTPCVPRRVPVVTTPPDPPVKPPKPPDPPKPPEGPRPMITTLKEPSGFLNARWGGGQSLIPPTQPDDRNRTPFERGRPTAGGDEQFRLVLFDHEVAIQTPNGRAWVSVQADGTLQERPVSDPTQPGPWERFTLSGTTLTSVHRPSVKFEIAGAGVGPGTGGGKEHGFLHAQGHDFYDEDGKLWLFAGYTMHTLPTSSFNGDNLDEILNEPVELGANVIVTINMHRSPWKHDHGFALDPFAPGYQDALARMYDTCAARGLRVAPGALADCQGLSDREILDVWHMNVEVARGRWNVLLRGGNEDGANGWDCGMLDHPENMGGVLVSRGSRGIDTPPHPSAWDFIEWEGRRDPVHKAMDDSGSGVLELLAGYDGRNGKVGPFSVPVLHIEPPYFHDTDRDEFGDERWTDVRLAAQLGAGISLYCPGGAFGASDGLICRRLGPHARACAEAFFRGLKAGFVR